MSSTVLILSNIISLFVGLVISFIAYKLVVSKSYLKSRLKTEYLKGKEDGEAKALEKFTISYDPFIEVNDTFFVKTAETGYIMQVFYNGLPFGEPTRRVLEHVEKYKEENAKLIIESITNTLSNIVYTSKTVGIPVTVNSQAKIEKKRK